MFTSANTLEFSAVIEQIIPLAQTSKGKQMVASIMPNNNKLAILHHLAETEQALLVLHRYQEPPMGGIREMEEILQKARIQSLLIPTELLDVVGLIEATSRNITYVKQWSEYEIDAPKLLDHYAQLQPTSKLRQAIEQIVTPDGQIYDNASSKLSSIRHAIEHSKRSIQGKLDQLLRQYKEKLTSQIVTIRNNRFVLPVRQSDKYSFPGMIVDYSSSGETVYMEPTAIQELNNKITLLQLDEQREIERLLKELTMLVFTHHDVLLQNYQVLTELDYIFAKAKYALINECINPIITDNTIHLIHARHPLILKEEVVPNTIRLNREKRIMIITGPNTGGKTVALKTMGLLSLMVQSGMLIPASEGSKTVLFDHVFADIGDEQSIEQSLSTFSSHMKRIINILDNMTPWSLILLDELGSGTDPKEGASLAIALLDHLRKRNMYVMATTHYPELKAYAYDKEEVVNASVEFDLETLKPTFRLLLGTPGRSNALAIARRLGLHEEIVQSAESHVVTSRDDIARLIEKLEEEGKRLDESINNYESLIAYEKQLVNENKELRKSLLKEKQKYAKQIELEKSQILIDTRKKAEQLITELEALRKRNTIKDHELAEVKYKTRQLNVDTTETSSTLGHAYQPGDLVNVLPFQRAGELVKKLKNGKWVVKMGSLISNHKEDELEFIEKKQASKPKQKKQIAPSPVKAAKSVLDLRGKRYEEAREELDNYIDHCMLTNQPYATIIHGYGTLTLRKLVKQYLDQHIAVASHRDGEAGEGGRGVTVVHFK